MSRDIRRDAEKYLRLAFGPDDGDSPIQGLEDFEAEEEDITKLGLDEVKERLNIKDDGIAVLENYINKYQGPHKLEDTLESFVSDVEQYALPAAQKMIQFLKAGMGEV